MLCETNAGSGGAGTLLKVKGYSELPASGKYGNIAVITSTAFKYWEVGYSVGENRYDGSSWQAGDVFFKLSTSPDWNINILKKCAISIGLAKCIQFDGTAWSNVQAHYFDTEWHKFSDVMMYLMQDGVFSEDYTFKAASGTWETDPYAVFDPNSLNWVWTYSSNGYRERLYDSSIRWLKMTSLFSVGSFTKVGIKYSLKTYDATVCRFGYNTATSSGTSVSDFTESPKYTTLTGSGLDTELTAYVDITAGHTEITPFIHVYNADMRIYDIWLE